MHLHKKYAVLCLGIFLFITILGGGIFLDVHKIIIIVSAFVVYLKLSYEVPCGTIQNPIPNGVKMIMAKELERYCQIGIFLLGGVSILNIDMGYFCSMWSYSVWCAIWYR